MPTPHLHDDVLLEAVALRNQHPTLLAAANAAGVSWHSFNNRLTRAAERGLDGSVPHPLPLGQRLAGVSTLYKDGATILEWVKTTAEQRQLEEFSATIREAFADHVSPRLPAAPSYTDGSLLSVYPIVDLHLGLYAWGKETGTDYDLGIAAKLLKATVAKLVARSADSKQALILDVGDYFHTDNSKNQTQRSKNSLDVDTRYGKVVQVGVELAVEIIELALQKHKHVTYRKLPGNHDDESSLMLAIALSAWFRNEKRVTISTDPSRFFMMQFGKCMLAATHGDMLRLEGMQSYMAATWPQVWGETEHRYGYTGHVHHDQVKSGNGVRVESFDTLAPKDAWHSQQGFVSTRSAVSITLHKDEGEIDRLRVSIPAVVPQ
jgi:hypothetical protein